MSSSDESTPPDLQDDAKSARDCLLPGKSKENYMKQYDAFMKWREEKHAHSFSENVLLAYFCQAAKTKKPPTLWAIYSMLRCTIHLKHGINIRDYKTLNCFLKRQSAGYKSKKSKIFTGENIEKFMNEAPDDRFLAMKVALVLGLNGACRCLELTNITVNDVEHHNNKIVVKLRDTKTKKDRMFVTQDDFLNVVQRYESLRPVDTNTDRFFLCYKNGKCTRQPIGRHTIAAMPKAIATFLNLPDVESYTGHCFRRSSATLLADSGANLTTLKRHGGWRSDQVAEGYIEDSIESKSGISNKITSSIQLKSSTITRPLSPQPCTSRQTKQNNSPQPYTSRQAKQNNSPQPCTSRQSKENDNPQPYTSRQAKQNNSPQPLASQEDSLPIPPLSPQVSQTFTSQAFTSQVPLTNLPSSQIQNNTINVPGNTIHYTFNNCQFGSNTTFKQN